MGKKCLLSLSILFLIASHVDAQSAIPLSKTFKIVSVSYSVPDNEQGNFVDVYFRFGWNDKSPYVIALQFANNGYVNRKIKFAIKDMTSQKMIPLDPVHKTIFASESLKSNGSGAIWSGPIENNKDSFSLHVWNSDGVEFVKVPISLKDQE